MLPAPDKIPLNAGGPPEKPRGGSKEHPKMGFNMDRGCTDCWMLFLAVAIWGIFAFFCNIVYNAGEPKRLLMGTDYLGNICGQGTPNVTVTDWANRTTLWYPVTFDFKQKKLLIREAMKLGICVSKCPSPSDLLIRPYGQLNATNALPPFWPVLFSSKPQFYRCVPNFFTFDCQNSSDCLKTLLSSNETFANAQEIGEMINQGIDEFRTSYVIILIGMGVAVVLSFVWLFILRRLVKPVAIITMFLVLLGLAGLGFLLFTQKAAYLAKEPPQVETSNYFFYGAIICWILAAIYLCVIVFIWTDVMIACDVIEEATHVPVAIPTVVLVPLFSFVAVLPFVVFAIITAIYIQSCGDVLNATIPTPAFVNASDPLSSPLRAYLANQTVAGIMNGDTKMDTRTYEFKAWRTWGHLANIFMFLWSFGLINAIGFLIVSLCAVCWYFSGPGDEKSPPLGAVARSAGITFRYHIGTLAFGAMIVAIIQTIRVGVCFLEQRLRQAGLDDKRTKFLLGIVKCLLACLERVIKFVNKNAYIVCAMSGRSFFPAALHALDLLKANALSVGAVNIIGEYVMIFGKVLITCLTAVGTYFIMKTLGHDQGISGGLLLIAVVIVLAFLISSLFAMVFSVCIDTVLLCFCEDKASCDDPVYCPLDLKAHIGNAARRAELKKQATQGQELAAKAVPLAGGESAKQLEML